MTIIIDQMFVMYVIDTMHAIGLASRMPNVNPIKYTTAFTMRVDQEFLDAVEELRRLQKGPIPTKADAVREAVMEALRRAKAKGKR